MECEVDEVDRVGMSPVFRRFLGKLDDSLFTCDFVNFHLAAALVHIYVTLEIMLREMIPFSKIRKSY